MRATIGRPSTRAASGRDGGPLASYERRSYWQATMPPMPDRRGLPLPDAADVVVVGGGYTGLSAARALARGGATVVLIEAETLGFGASTRNGGMVHPGYKWGPAELVRRYGEDTGRALYRESVDAYETVKRIVADEAIECELDDRGQITLAWAPSHVANLHAAQAGLASVGVEATFVARERLREEIGSDAYHAGLTHDLCAGIHPAKFLAGLATSADAAGARLHEGVRAISVRPQADGRTVVETSDGPIIAGEVVVATNGYTDGVAPGLRRRVIPIGSYVIVTEPLAPGLAAEISPRGRMFVDTKNFLYYWRVTADCRMMFGGRASFMPTSVERTAAILQRGLATVHPELASTRIDYAWGGNVAFTADRMPHVGRRDGITYAMGYCGSGVAMSTYLGMRVGEWLAGGPAPTLASLPFPLVPVPFEGRPWFLPFLGEWYRLADRRALSGRSSGDGPEGS